MSWLFLLPILWSLQNILHESCHALVVHQLGGTITKFSPWPGFLMGRFTMARVEWTLPAVDEVEMGAIYAAPLVVNTLLVLVALMAHGHLWALILGALNFVDGAFNLSTFARRRPNGADGWRVQAAFEIPVATCRVAAVVWVACFGLPLSVWAWELM